MNPRYLILALFVALAFTSCRKDVDDPSDRPSRPDPDPFVPHIERLNGLFSVGADAQVQFACGNVQYRPRTSDWTMAAHQYSIVGAANELISPSYSGWVDLFGWGTGSNPLQADIDTGSYAQFVDWGIHFGQGWRTLSEEEWEHLLYYRANAAQRHTTAIVCGTDGLLLLPDEWHAPAGISVVTHVYDYRNQYTSQQFRALQDSGAVFLPTAGFRQQTEYHPDQFCYWTSSTVGMYGYEGIRVYLDMSNDPVLKGMSAYCGLAVRLVYDANQL